MFLHQKKIATVLATLGLLLLVSCKKDATSSENAAQQGSLTSLVQKDADLSLLTVALNRAGLTALLSTATPYTLFAPNNAAFKAYLGAATDADALNTLNGADTAVLANTLRYHLVRGANLQADLPLSGGLVTLPTTSNAQLLLHQKDKVVKVNTATVTTPDVSSGHGVLHKIDQVLVQPDKDLFGLAQTKGLTVFGVAAQKAILAGSLKALGPYTLFAPTDAAFIAYFQANGYPSVTDAAGAIGVIGTLSLAQLTYELLPVLQNHVLAYGQIVYMEDVPDTTSYTTLSPGVAVGVKKNGTSIKVGVPGGPPPATIQQGDFQASNGILHIIDQVIGASLTTPTVLFRIATDTSLTTLAAIITKTNLGAILSGSAPITFFAPTNAAFKTYFNTKSDNTLRNIVTYLPLDSAKALIQYHLLGGAKKVADLPVDGLQGTGLFANGAIGGKMYVYQPSPGVVILNEFAHIITADIGASNGILHKIDGVLPPTNFDIAQTILLQQLSKFPNLQIFSTFMVKGATATAFVQAQGPYTLFVPTDSAYVEYFSTYPALIPSTTPFTPCGCSADVRNLLKLVQNPFQVTLSLVQKFMNPMVRAATLNSVVPNRKLPNATLATASDSVQIITTNDGAGNITVTGRDGVTAKVISPNHFTANGVFHIINKVIDSSKP